MGDADNRRKPYHDCSGVALPSRRERPHTEKADTDNTRWAISNGLQLLVNRHVRMLGVFAKPAITYSLPCLNHMDISSIALASTVCAIW
jgi:hypothetical protein